MALLKCPECGQMVSEHAVKCPNCACPIDRIKVVATSATEPVKEKEYDSSKCWFCQENEVTHLHEHTFYKKEYRNTTMMRKSRTLSNTVKIPCCDKCEEAIQSEGTYQLWFVIIGTLGVLVPLDYWLYTIEPGLLIAAIVFEICFVALLVAAFFAWIGSLIWKATHKELSKQLKRDFDEHSGWKNLQRYSATHPMTKPTFSEFLGIK